MRCTGPGFHFSLERIRLPECTFSPASAVTKCVLTLEKRFYLRFGLRLIARPNSHGQALSLQKQTDGLLAMEAGSRQNSTRRSTVPRVGGPGRFRFGFHGNFNLGAFLEP